MRVQRSDSVVYAVINRGSLPLYNWMCVFVFSMPLVSQMFEA